MFPLPILVADASHKAEAQQRPPTLHIPKNRDTLSPTSNIDAQRESSRSRGSIDELAGSLAEGDLDGMARCVTCEDVELFG